MTCFALVPVKAADHGKQRLAGLLDSETRRRLVELMLEDVLGALRRSRAIDRIAIVAPEPPTATAGDVIHLPDAGGGLNRAVSLAAASLRERGASELVVLHGDLPLLGGKDIDQLVDAGRRAGIALATDRAGKGTNAIYLRLPAPFNFCFGFDSLARHRAQAGECGITPAVLRLAGLNFDVDEPADLELLLESRGSRYHFLREALRSAGCIGSIGSIE